MVLVARTLLLLLACYSSFWWSWNGRSHFSFLRRLPPIRRNNNDNHPQQHSSSTILHRKRTTATTLQDALQQVREAGLHVCVLPSPQQDLPLLRASDEQDHDPDDLIQQLVLLAPSCPAEAAEAGDDDEDEDLDTIIIQQNQQQDQQPQRSLQEEEEESNSSSVRAYLTNLLCALACISVAALAAGLTLGMLGLDPLLLLIKERAATDLHERRAAATLRPIVQQHHRLLVTLLLMNAVANEALPLFLEALVPNPASAVAVSVTLVLFCGEIIPSAIFTGPNQLHIACALVPLVKVVLWLLYPLAGPLAWLLDTLLHHDGDDGTEDGDHGDGAYTRGELAALIRIQYEERVAAKLKRKQQRKSAVDATGVVHHHNSNHVGGLDFAHRQSIRAAKHHAERSLSTRTTASSSASEQQPQQQPPERRESLHVDEVVMIEGALSMKTKTALDVFTSYRKVFCIPSDMLLNEDSMVHIYASGFTRIPVYQAGGPRTAIVGVLMTKQLIVVSDRSERPVGTLPLRLPRCVGPDTPLVNMVNMFQTGGHGSRGGHLALVCARPAVAEQALLQGNSVPESAGLMGIITLEDVLEMLLQVRYIRQYVVAVCFRLCIWD